jgi:hypothetical protein
MTRLTLAEYIMALVQTLAIHERPSAERLRLIVGERTARISLDDETVDVAFAGLQLVVTPASPAKKVDGFGGTDRGVTLALLDGRIEVNEAIFSGRLEVNGDLDGVNRIGMAIDVLLDASTRVPPLRQLARRFIDESADAAPAPVPSVKDDRAEMALLGRLGLLPEGVGR